MHCGTGNTRVLTGVVYPLAVTGLSQAFFSHKAGGSMIVEEGKVVGSALIGQPFADPGYFWSRRRRRRRCPTTRPPRPAPTWGPPTRLCWLRWRRASGRSAPPTRVTPGRCPSIWSRPQPAASIPISARGGGVPGGAGDPGAGLVSDVVRALVAEHTEGRNGGSWASPESTCWS